MPIPLGTSKLESPKTLPNNRYLIEGFQRQLCKATKTKGVLPSEQALMKMLFHVQLRIA